VRRVLLALLWWPVLAPAHPLAPALLELRETAPAQYETLWRTSVLRARGVNLEPLPPAGCRADTPQPAQLEGRDALVLRGRLDCSPAGLAGKTLHIAGLDRSNINVIVQWRPLLGEPRRVLLDAAQPSYTVPAPGTAAPVFGRYLGLGIEHLLLGPDHLLFVAGLVLLVRGARRLLLTVTAFTLGHSLTLALAVLGLVRVNPALTELGIAASLLWLALDAVRPATRPGLFARRPALLAISFGLLHGLGFAGALSAVGLPAGEIALALLAFNLGIELGQIGVIASLLALAALWRTPPPPLARLARRAPAYLIGALAVYWCLERGTAWLA
jgi:hydrogenase/urease accessory protein HupE